MTSRSIEVFPRILKSIKLSDIDKLEEKVSYIDKIKENVYDLKEQPLTKRPKKIPIYDPENIR